MCLQIRARAASASQEVVVLPLAEASAEHKRGASVVLNYPAWGAHPFKAIRPDLVELRQEVRADIVALYSRIDSLDARFTSRIDALYQALFSRKVPAAWPEPATVPLK